MKERKEVLKKIKEKLSKEEQINYQQAEVTGENLCLKENLPLLNFPLPLTLTGPTGMGISPLNTLAEFYVLLNFLP